MFEPGCIQVMRPIARVPSSRRTVFKPTNSFIEIEYEHEYEDEIGAGERELGVRDRATSTNPTASF
jgi:hypothetical protein